MKNYLFIALALLTITLASCSKDTDTLAIITVEQANGDPAAGITVYAYDSGTWDLFGDDSFFADKTVATNTNGVASILLDDILNLFAFDNQETVYFSAHYTLNGVDKMKSTSLTFKEGQEKSATIVID